MAMTDERLVEVLERADELVVRAMNEDAVPGMGVGIVRGSERIYAKGFGQANAERGRPVSPRTVFRIGSISKTMTAIGLMQLWERGLFDLDDPVNDHLRSYKLRQSDPTAPPVTFRHMLTHTAGIGEVRGPRDLFRPVIGLGAKPGKPVPTPAEYYPKGLRPAVRPGTKWAYSNHAFNTLGQLVEDISGEPFATYMRRQVFEPLGMESTDYLLSERVREGLAQGYNFSKSKLKPVDYLEITVRGAGSVFSTVEDMCLYAAALLGGGENEYGRVLDQETLSLMMEPHYRLDDRLPAMGFAFLLDDFDGHTVAGHDGGWPGFFSSMVLCPSEEVGVVAFVNASSKAAQQAADGLMRRLLDVSELHLRLPHKGVLESPHLWSELRGFYGPEGPLNTDLRLWGAYAGELEVRVEDKHVVLHALAGPLRKGARLYPADPSDPLAFEVLIEGQAHPVVFWREQEGSHVSRLCIGFDRLAKRSRASSVRFRAQAGAATVAAAGFVAATWLGVRELQDPNVHNNPEGVF
jgi:CubicO group peptidase (beta-lactamase class C family)